MRFTLILAAALALPVGARAAAPQVYVVSDAPIQLSGSGFHAGEKVTVRMSVAGGASFARTVAATRTGKITLRFAGHSMSDCDTYSLSAVGNAGSRVTKKLVIPPACGIDVSP